MEGWAEVRVGGTTEWQRVWFVVSAMGSGSIDAGRPASSGSGPGTIKRNRMSSIFGKGASYNAANQSAQPTITLYTGEKAKDRKRPKYTLTNVTQAFAVYPERPEIIQSSTLFKVEATVQDEEIRAERTRMPTCSG
jgi:CCR4-NOT transcriptional complex subunit CAF120